MACKPPKDNIPDIMRKHKIKIWPNYFRDVVSGLKKFEFRENDRNYNVGEFILLQEFEPVSQTYTGAEQMVAITYLFEGGKDFPGIDKGYCIFGIELAHAEGCGVYPLNSPDNCSCGLTW